MDIAEFSKLIAKYRRGELSPRERERLESFLESFQTNPGDWIENEMGNRTALEKKILARVLRRIKKEKNRHLTAIFLSPSSLKRAAAVAIFFILSSGILYLAGAFHRTTKSVIWHGKSTPVGERCVLTLSDGSRVTLNADSKLKYPDRFTGADREVYLQGEGYFVVRHDKNRPFVVHTGNLSTTVLGTKFDVSAYPESETVAVSLLEGKVRVTRTENGTVVKTIVLKRKEQLLYDRENDTNSLGPVDSLEAVGWIDDIYKFVDEPLGDVISQLERVYGVRLTIMDQPVLVRRITVEFEKNSLLTVIDVIRSLTGLNYKIIKLEGKVKKVVFFESTK